MSEEKGEKVEPVEEKVEAVTKEQMLLALKANYQALDAQINLCHLGNGREMQLSKIKLEESFMWLRAAIEIYEPPKGEEAKG